MVFVLCHFPAIRSVSRSGPQLTLLLLEQQRFDITQTEPKPEA